MNLLRFGFLASCLVSLLSACATVTEPELEPKLEVPPEQVIKKPKAGPITVMAVGDIMLGTDFPDDRLPPDGGSQLLTHVAAILKTADITFGNYEGTFLDGGEQAKTCRDLRRCYLFRTPPQSAQHLSDAGFDVISLANNHARDFGEHGRNASMAVLRALGIEHSGREGDIASWEVKGRRVALIAFAPFRGSHNPLMTPYVKQQVMALAERHDLVMVSMHMGAEGETATRIPFTEERFHGENRGDVVAFARAAIDAGADLVLGHGPHVPRALELYKNRLIAYSLGNFCTYYGINVRGLNGLAPILRVQLGQDGHFQQGEIISARQFRPNGPIPDPSHQAARLMAELTQLDFPASPLEISPSGQITVKTDTQSRQESQDKDGSEL